MPSWLISLMLATGVTAWAYNKLARTNGNASPKSNFILAFVGGAVVFLVFLFLMELVLDF